MRENLKKNQNFLIKKKQRKLSQNTKRNKLNQQLHKRHEKMSFFSVEKFPCGFFHFNFPLIIFSFFFSCFHLTLHHKFIKSNLSIIKVKKQLEDGGKTGGDHCDFKYFSYFEDFLKFCREFLNFSIK